MRRTAVLAVLAVLTLVPLGLLPAAHAAGPQCNGVDATVVGTDEPEKLFGTEGPDVAFLGAGDDTFVGRGGDDLICGGDGNDKLYTGAGDDTVFGEDGVDTVYEGPGDDVLNGGPDSDILNYSLLGLDLGNDGAQLRLDARTGKATSTLGTDTFTRFDAYVGSSNKDTLIGSAAKERIAAGQGDGDVLYGFGGSDQLIGNGIRSVIDAGEGNDAVRGNELARVVLGPGDDRLVYDFTTGLDAGGTVLVGGTGFDGVYLGRRTAGFEINLNREFVRHNATGDRSRLVGFENVQGSPGPDRIVGNAAPNFLSGHGGNDTVLGLGGDDHLYGGDGRDVADGGTGGDKCLYFESLTSC